MHDTLPVSINITFHTHTHTHTCKRSLTGSLTLCMPSGEVVNIIYFAVLMPFSMPVTLVNPNLRTIFLKLVNPVLRINHANWGV